MKREDLSKLIEEDDINKGRYFVNLKDHDAVYSVEAKSKKEALEKIVENINSEPKELKKITITD